jgi:hypothetical protein
MKTSDLPYELRTDGEDWHALKARGKPTPERRLAVRIETAAGVPVSAAAIVHAAASLYLGLAARNLRDAVAAGFSLADVATSHTLSLAGLERALQNALRRVRGGDAATTAAVADVVDVAAQGWSAWQARVEQMLATRDLDRHAGTAA